MKKNMINLAICNATTDSYFQEKNAYDIIRVNCGIATVVNGNGLQFEIGLDDTDFTFIFNFPKEKLGDLKCLF